MKFIELDIYGFGPLRQQTIKLGAACTFIYGPNESGKSTLLRAIRACLFGFATKKEEQRFSPTAGGVFGARLSLIHQGEQLTVERTFPQRKKGPVLRKEGADPFFVNEKDWLAKIAPLTPSLFDTIFSFEGGEPLNWGELSAEQIQHNLLSFGLTGSDRLVTQSKVIHKAAQGLYRPTGTKSRINQQLVELKEVKRKIQQAEQQQAELQHLSQAEEEAQTKLSELRQSQQLTQTKQSFVAQQQRLYPQYERLGALRQRMAQARVPAAQRPAIVAKLTRVEDAMASQTSEKEQATWQELQKKSPKIAFYRQHATTIRRLLRQRDVVDAHYYSRQHLNQQQEAVATQQAELTAHNPIVHNWQGNVADVQALQTIGDRQRALREKQQVLTLEKERALTKVRQQEQILDQRERQDVPKGTSFSLLWIILGVGALLGGLVALLWHQWLIGGIAAVLLLFTIWHFFGKKLLTSSEKLAAEQETERLLYHQLDLAQSDVLAAEAALKELMIAETELKQQRVVLCQQLGLPDAELPTQDALSTLADFSRLRAEAERLQQQSVQLDAEERALKNEWQVLEDWVPLERLSVKEIFEMVDRDWQISQKERDSTPDLKLFEQQTQRIEQQLAEANQELIPYGIEVNEATLHHVRAELQAETEAAEMCAVLEEELRHYYPQDAQLDAAELAAQATNLEASRQTIERKQKECEQRIVALGIQLAVFKQDETLDYLYQQQAECEAALRESSQQWQTYVLAEELIHEYLEKMAEHQLAHLLRSATYFFREATNQKNQTIEMRDGELRIRRQEAQVYGLEQLSTGTQIQLLLAFRFAYIQLHGDELAMPVMIDDGWVHADRERKEAFFRMVAKLSQHVQVLLLSSDETLKAWYNETKDAHWLELTPVSVGQ